MTSSETEVNQSLTSTEIDTAIESIASVETGNEITGADSLTETANSQDTATTHENNQSTSEIGTQASVVYDLSVRTENSILGAYTLTDTNISSEHSSGNSTSLAFQVESATVTATVTAQETFFEISSETVTSTETGNDIFGKQFGYRVQQRLGQLRRHDDKSVVDGLQHGQLCGSWLKWANRQFDQRFLYCDVFGHQHVDFSIETNLNQSSVRYRASHCHGDRRQHRNRERDYGQRSTVTASRVALPARSLTWRPISHSNRSPPKLLPNTSRASRPAIRLQAPTRLRAPPQAVTVRPRPILTKRSPGSRSSKPRCRHHDHNRKRQRDLGHGHGDHNFCTAVQRLPRSTPIKPRTILALRPIAST